MVGSELGALRHIESQGQRAVGGVRAAEGAQDELHRLGSTATFHSVVGAVLPAER